jgi:hypothetical protein
MYILSSLLVANRFFLSVEGLDLSLIDCLYSPAKRRGPVPGRMSSGASLVRKSSATEGTLANHHMDGGGTLNNANNINWASALPMAAFSGSATLDPGSNTNNSALELQFLHQIVQQQQQQAASINMDQDNIEHPARRVKLDDSLQQRPPTVPRTVSDHAHLLDRNDQTGSHLYAYYKLSVDELFRLPLTPTNEEFCVRLTTAPAGADAATAATTTTRLHPQMIPGPQLAALSAVRFAEIALGAIVHNEVELAMQLCNATVHCLRESVQELVHQCVTLEVAKAYFLLGVFRAFRGDMVRYFKYRRVSMTHLAKLEVGL